MIKLPEDIKALIAEAKREFPDKGVGFNYDEWDNLDQFRSYLKQLLAEKRIKEARLPDAPISKLLWGR